MIKRETFQAQTKDMVLRNSIIIIYNRMSFYVVLAVNWNISIRRALYDAGTGASIVFLKLHGSNAISLDTVGRKLYNLILENFLE